MSSQIGRSAHQMSLRTGIPVCQHGNLPIYHPTTGGWGGGSVFGQYGYGRPMGFYCGSSLFRASLITNIVCSCVDCAVGLTRHILNWCGIGGGGAATQTTSTTTQQTDGDLQLLQNTFKDNDDYDYEIHAEGNGRFTVTARSKNGGQNKLFQGTKDEILNQAGYGQLKAKSESEIRQLCTSTQQALTEAIGAAEGDAKKITVPHGYKNPTYNVDNYGRITVTVAPEDGNTEATAITVKGTDVADVVNQLRNKCTQVRQSQQAKAYEQATQEIGKEENADLKRQIEEKIAALDLPEGTVLTSGFVEAEDGSYKPAFVIAVGAGTSNQPATALNTQTEAGATPLIATSMQELLEMLENYQPPEAVA